MVKHLGGDWWCRLREDQGSLSLPSEALRVSGGGCVVFQESHTNKNVLRSDEHFRMTFG